MALRSFLILLLVVGIGSCTRHRVGQQLPRRGDEIVVAGQFFHTGAPVVTWMDPGGYDAYRVERRFVAYEKSGWGPTTRESRDIDSPNRYGLRASVLTAEEIEQVRGGGWPLAMLRDKVDQFVMHYDVCGTSRQCFNILHDKRNLSVHFMLDLDGTIYQTLDLKERAWHAGTANSRSIGIEIANIGAYALNDATLEQWYAPDETGRIRNVFPAWMTNTGIRTPDFIPRPARPVPIVGEIQGRRLKMYDLTPQQYASLVKLTAAVCTALPKIRCDYPRDAEGRLITRVLPEDQLNGYQGLLGHYHITAGKVDPGPAFQWDYIVTEARKLMKR